MTLQDIMVNRPLQETIHHWKLAHGLEKESKEGAEKNLHFFVNIKSNKHVVQGLEHSRHAFSQQLYRMLAEDRLKKNRGEQRRRRGGAA